MGNVCVGCKIPEELRVGSFSPDRFPTLCLDSIVSPFRPRWVKGVCMFR